ncbi:MAG: hypothetical protein AB7P08_09725, partial [Burkholderiales bacterium]
GGERISLVANVTLNAFTDFQQWLDGRGAYYVTEASDLTPGPSPEGVGRTRSGPHPQPLS